MRRIIFLLLLLSATSRASAQTPIELLRLAQDTYKSPAGYQINGEGSVQPLGSSWQINFSVVIAAAPAPLGSTHTPVVPAGRIGGPMQYVNVGGGTDAHPTSVNIPFGIANLWTIAQNVISVTETGSEVLPLNGATTKCRVLLVEYRAAEDATKPSSVAYSICSDRHLVLKKVMSYPSGWHETGAPVPWTITFATAKFNRPAPQWLAEMKELPSVTTRKEWLGHPAPDFKLPDLNGDSVTLSSMRGKVVLLDFWSISCGPCIREMPMIEATGETHKGKLAVWGISFDQPDRDKKWLLQHQRSLPTLSDPDFATLDLYKVHGVPALVLIDADGKIRNYWEGSVQQSELEAAIRRASKQ
jgi:peroxiredoxin